MLAVGVATLLTCLIRKRNLATLGWGWGSWKYQWLSYVLPLAIAVVAYLIIWVAGWGGWYNSEFVNQQMNEYNLSNWSDAGVIAFHFLLTATYSFVLLLPSVLGEEIGWRGFLVPELAKFMSFTSQFGTPIFLYEKIVGVPEFTSGKGLANSQVVACPTSTNPFWPITSFDATHSHTL
jgi:membrane protease YdiL (CAAX protease family)